MMNIAAPVFALVDRYGSRFTKRAARHQYDTGPVLWALVSSGQAEHETAAGLVRQGSVGTPFLELCWRAGDNVAGVGTPRSPAC